jgi:hypothetical protein
VKFLHGECGREELDSPECEVTKFCVPGSCNLYIQAFNLSVLNILTSVGFVKRILVDVLLT